MNQRPWNLLFDRLFTVTRPQCALLLVLLAVLLASGPAWSQTQFFGETVRVNDPDQTDSYPSIDSNTAGMSVIVWACVLSNATGINSDICARRLSPTGRLVGSEFVVNTERKSVQQFADVAIDDEGNFFIVWESNADDDGDDWSVLGRLYEANGTPKGAPFVLSTITESRQRDPAVAWRKGRGWVVTWESAHDFPDQVYARLFNQAGAPAAPEFRVSLDGPGISLENAGNSNAAIATDASGNFVIAWQGPRQEIIGGSEVFVRRYSATGNLLAGTRAVATQPESQKSFPDVAMHPSGAFVVAYARTNGTIEARVYNASAQPQGGEFKVNQGEASGTAPAVGVAPSGRFVVAWAGAASSTPNNRINVRQRAFAASGSPLEGEQEVDDTGTRPRIAVDGGGDVALVFHDNGPDAGLRRSQLAMECVAADSVACIQNDRFKVEAAWRAFNGDVGLATAEELTSETQTFWFFSQENIELVVKILDACDFTGSYWVFAAGATNVEIDLGVTDTELGKSMVYFNPLGSPFETVRSVGEFTCDASAGRLEVAQASAIPTLEADGRLGWSDQAQVGSDSRAVAAEDCNETGERLCLNQGRFAVEVTYTTDGTPKTGNAVPLSTESGYFWFFGADNLEILIKVIDGCPINQRFWVFGAGLTDVQLSLTVTDTATGQKKTYINPAGKGFAPILDTGAFATC